MKKNGKKVSAAVAIFILLAAGIAFVLINRQEILTGKREGEMAGKPFKNYEISLQEYTIENAGDTISGTLYLPQDGLDSRGIVIMSHGLNGTSKDCGYYAKMLSEAGVAAYAFDFCGGSNEGKSSGATTEMTVRSEISDLECVIDMAKSWEWVDKEHVVLMGQSQGGLIAALTAAQRNDIDSLVLFYPAFSIPDSLKRMYGELGNVPETFQLVGVELGKQYCEEIWDKDFYQEAARFEGDVLIIHGTRDSVIAYGSSMKALKYYQNAELYSIRGADHGFAGKDAAGAAEKTIQFVLGRLDE